MNRTAVVSVSQKQPPEQSKKGKFGCICVLAVQVM